MKKALISVILIMLCIPVSFSFINTRDYLGDIVGTANGAVNTIKGVFGNDVKNNVTPQTNNIGDEYLELGVGGESRLVKEYVEWRLKRDNEILNESLMSVVYVSNDLYECIVRDEGDFFRRPYTAIRLTLAFDFQDRHHEVDALWIGPYHFDNYDGEPFIGNSGDDFQSALYLYSSDGFLHCIWNALDIWDMSDGKFNTLSLFKIPVGVHKIESTFIDYWSEWTGG